jgi:hypothetical protein
MKNILMIIMSTVLVLGCTEKKEEKSQGRPSDLPPQQKAENLKKNKQPEKVVAPKKNKTKSKNENLMDLEEVKARISSFKPMKIDYPPKDLTSELKPVVTELIKAAMIMDEIFFKQVSMKNLEYKKEIEAAVAKNPEKQPYLELYQLMFGPWDRTDDNKPFWDVGPKPAGAGFYDQNLTKSAFNLKLKSLESALKSAKTTKIKNNIQKKIDDLKSLYTIVLRRNGKFKTIKYSQYFKTELSRAGEYLKKAASLTTDNTLKKYLVSRADAFITDDYLESDFAWLKLEGAIEFVIGPYEVYEDKLNGYKAAFESFVTIVDKEYTAKLQEFVKYSQELEKNLPYKKVFPGKGPKNLPIKVVNELFTAGDTKAGIQTLAFNLPNDPRVRQNKKKGGYKLVLLKNVAEAKYKAILVPIAKLIIDSSQQEYISFDAFFTHTLYHEAVHGIGPVYARKNGKKVEIRQELKEYGSANEEAKADMGGLLGLDFMVKQKKKYGEEALKKGYVTFVASIFRSIRFGVNEAHGKANLMALNYLLNEKAVVFDPTTTTFKINFEKISGATRNLVKEIIKVQTDADYEKAKAFEEKWGKVFSSLKKAIAKLKTIPIDIRPQYTVLKELGLKK